VAWEALVIAGTVARSCQNYNAPSANFAETADMPGRLTAEDRKRPEDYLGFCDP